MLSIPSFHLSFNFPSIVTSMNFYLSPNFSIFFHLSTFQFPKQFIQWLLIYSVHLSFNFSPSKLTLMNSYALSGYSVFVYSIYSTLNFPLYKTIIKVVINLFHSSLSIFYLLSDVHLLLHSINLLRLYPFHLFIIFH